MTDKEHIFGDLKMTQGTSDYFQSDSDFESRLSILKDKIREFFNLKNVNFLFGSGTSNGAIPTMSSLYTSLSFTDEEKDLKTEFNSIATKCEGNLEKCLTVMYAARTHYQGINLTDKKQQEKIDAQLMLYESMIEKVEKHIFNSINIRFDKDEHKKVLEYYKTFYQKLALRTKDNSRIRVFTTNNDLFSETALDA